MTDDQPPEFDADVPESLLPYDQWVEDAYREVMLRAIEHAAEAGLPGEHHFYLTFRTDAPGVVIPQRLRAQYPHEMTIVLQHQFWDLAVDRDAETISVGLSFGGVGSILVIPVRAVTAFADPHVRVAMRFQGDADDFDDEGDDGAPEVEAESPAPEEPPEDAQVVSLDAFRRKPPGRD
ncbi:SspB family protein [Tanticharoenia sakaeratensis]|uniref:Stringent starvation protein B n=1 Tax=Tanticharoenia sakaeratensis NBRC 103193 TaxID=1231623 RepID=A0A0D6MGY0_9PROT|nr:ClpXP protease specificity-enhancing factor SspB [Tanticharoenia sakaeratensis]GAN52746.1 hypothetical protein Tasa_002_026 [Tanticharoenia sakaeratensis NBRC 103193]GBQ17898.1 hypothetical protein AA103193_0511 [Tanticharoenia sakaeratensis NBRC 103193]